MSAVVIAWVSADGTAGESGIVALACVIVLSVALGRVLPGWGFAAPAILAAGWLITILIAIDPAPPDAEAPTARALAYVYLVAVTVGAEVGVLLGAMSAAWSRAGRPDSSGPSSRPFP